MALWQFGYLVRDRALTADSGTVYVDLPRDEQIAAILLNCRATAGDPADVAGSRSMLDVVSDVQVLLEGSKTAYRANPAVGSFIQVMATGASPNHYLNTTGVMELNLIIPFGRYFMDSQYMLDTSRYTSAQLQFAYALDGTHEASGSFVYSVGILRPVEKVNPLGFIRHRIVNTHITSGSAEVYEVNLPTGLKWLAVGFRAYRWGSFIDALLTDVDLDIGEGRLHLFQGGIAELLTLNEVTFGPNFAAPHTVQMLADGDTAPTFLGNPRAVMVKQMATTAVANALAAVSGTSFTLEATGLTSRTPFVCQSFGGAPFSGLLVFDGREQPFNAAVYADASMEFRFAATTSVVDVFVSEVVEGIL